MMFTARRRAFAAQLGLLAFVLIVLAPLASQLRAEPAAGNWLNELACHEGTGAVPAPLDSRKPVLQVDACGYCSLLSHCPALAGSPWLPARHLPPSPRCVAALPAQPPLSPHFPRALPRAPPMPA